MDRVVKINNGLKDLMPEDLIGFLQPTVLDPLIKQKTYDYGVHLKAFRKEGEKYIPEPKDLSNTQFCEKEKFEAPSDLDEIKNTKNGKNKRTKGENTLEDKDSLKECLEKKRRSPWIVIGYIAVLSISLLGLIILSVIGYIYSGNIISEMQTMYNTIDISSRRLADLLYVKDHVRSLILSNTYFY